MAERYNTQDFFLPIRILFAFSLLYARRNTRTLIVVYVWYNNGEFLKREKKRMILTPL